MNKHQIIALLVAILMVGLLYMLPRVVVDNDKLIQEEELGSVTETGQQSGSDEVIENLSQEDSLKIIKFTQLITSGLSENNTKFADSLARIYVKHGSLDKAKEIAKKLEKLEKRLAGRLYYLLMSKAMNEKEASFFAGKARSFLAQYAEQGDLDAKAKVAMTYISSANPMQGVMMLREVIAQDSNHVEGLYNLGILSIKSGQYDKAIGRFEKLLSISEDHVMAKAYLGVSYFEIGRLEEAKGVFTELSNAEDESVLQLVDEYLQKLN